MMLLLQLTCLIVLYAVYVSGEIIIKQVNTATTESWIIRQTATYEHGGDSPKLFNFQCTSDVNNGDGLAWQRTDALLDITQVVITSGVELQLTQPVAGSAGTYRCSDSVTMEQSEFILTTEDPSVLSETDTLVHYVGDTVIINMFASTLMPLSDDIIIWKINNTAITDGTYNNSKTTLTISDVQLSDAGTYAIVVTIGINSLASVGSANTLLQVLALPVITIDPVSMTTMEWQTVTLNCTGSNGVSVTWHKENSDLSMTSSSNITVNNGVTVTSVLTITELRTIDSGQYYCNITTNDGLRYDISSSTALTVTDGTRLSFTPDEGVPVITSDPLLYLDINTFNITCEGSSLSLYWTDPNNNNVSFTDTDNPYQYNLPGNGFSRLQFTSFTSQSSGLYSCVSEQQINSIYISNANPIIYTDNDHVIVGQITDVILTVYVGGTNPIPTATNITWTYNNSTIVNNMYYKLQNGNTELIIANVPSNITTGLYQATVTTAQGTHTVNINISYFDPPVVMTSPDSITTLEGDTVSFNCTADSQLTVLIAWYSGNTFITNGNILTINNITSTDSGVYTCVATDSEGLYTIREHVSLVVEYAPIVFVSTILISHKPSLIIYLNESDPIPTYLCSADGYPEPSLIWKFNGGGLPNGIISQSTGKFQQLHWTRNVLYSDNGVYTCHASNDIGQSVANISMNFYAIPLISTVYSTDNTVLFTNSSNPLIVQSSIATFSLTCLAYGLPVPSLHWFDNNGTQLTITSIQRSCGLVETTLQWNRDMISGPVRCIVTNTFGSNSVTVLAEDNNTVIDNDNIVMDAPTDREMITIRIKVNIDDCKNNTLADIQTPLISAIRLTTLFTAYQSCDAGNLMINVTSKTCIPAESTANSSIFIVAVTTGSTTQTQDAYNAIGNWIITNPFIFFNNLSYQLDSDCDLLVQESDSLYSCIQVSTTPIPTIPATIPTIASNSLTIIWIIIVGVILLLLLVVVTALVLVLFLCMKSMKNNHNNRTGAKSEAWSADQSNEVISLATWRTASTNVSSQEFCTTSFPSNQLQYSQDSSNAAMIDNPEYLIGTQLQHIRQSIINEAAMDEIKMLPTTPTNEQTDSSNDWTGNNYHTRQNNNDAIQFMSHDSIRSTTPIPEQLEDPTYAIIRPDARVDERRLPPLDHTHHRRATLPSPVRVSPSKRIQPILYSEPHSHNNNRTSSSPALHQPLPYSQPVSSMGSLQNVGKMNYRPLPPDRSISSPSRGGGTGSRLTSSLNVVDEVQPHWYNSADSDIVTPTFGDPIEPYATTPSSLIEASPYSQPGRDSTIASPYSQPGRYSTIASPYSQPGFDSTIASPYSEPGRNSIIVSPYSESGNIDQHSTISSNSPSTIRPSYIHTATVQYETINV